MKFGKAINYKIIIEATDNKGFIAKVGCGIFAFSNKEDLREAFNTFLDDPEACEENYNKTWVGGDITEGVREGVREESPTRRELGSMGPDPARNVTGTTERNDRGYLR